ncbi:MAG: hypothetical protein MIO88_01210 [Methanoregulaceae archaeon]|nr:hypothetical protein [Methanoregulaceae archaeon]
MQVENFGCKREFRCKAAVFCAEPEKSVRKWIKHGVKVVLDGNLNPATIIVILCKKPILILLDELIPDEEEEEK